MLDKESNGGSVLDCRLILKLCCTQRILITKTVSCAVFDLHNSVFGYGRYSLNARNRGRGIKASRGEGTDGMGGGAERPRGSSQHSALPCTQFHPEEKQERKHQQRKLRRKSKEGMHGKERLEGKGFSDERNESKYAHDSRFSTNFRLGTLFTSASHKGFCDSIARSAEDVVRVVHEDYVSPTVHLCLPLTKMETERFMGTKRRGITATTSTCGI